MTIVNDYRFESVRLDSFKGWPHLWMKPEVLAAAGFYYTGESDKVKCFMCNQEIHEWEPGDNPMIDHRRYSESCDFVQNIPCGNVPIGTDPSTIPIPDFKEEDVCGFHDMLPMLPMLRRNPYFVPRHNYPETVERENYWLMWLRHQTLSMPQYPEYSSYNARLASYDRWPKAMSQTEKLATAGFYYSGNNDETVCYYCDGRLKNWEPDDDPWVEHAKWFHYCPYLLIIKGTEFINNVAGTTYIKINTIPHSNVIDTLDEEFEKTDNGNIANKNPQNSTCTKEINFNDTKVISSASDEANKEHQSKSVETQDDKNAKL